MILPVAVFVLSVHLAQGGPGGGKIVTKLCHKVDKYSVIKVPNHFKM